MSPVSTSTPLRWNITSATPISLSAARLSIDVKPPSKATACGSFPIALTTRFTLSSASVLSLGAPSSMEQSRTRVDQFAAPPLHSIGAGRWPSGNRGPSGAPALASGGFAYNTGVSRDGLSLRLRNVLGPSRGTRAAQNPVPFRRPPRISGTCSVNAAHGLERCWWLGKHARSEIRGIPRGARFCEGAGSAFGALTSMRAASSAPESVTIRTPCCSLTACLSTDSSHTPAAMDRRGDGGVSAPSGVAARGVRTRPGGRRPFLGGSWLAGLAGVVVVGW